MAVSNVLIWISSVQRLIWDKAIDPFGAADSNTRIRHPTTQTPHLLVNVKEEYRPRVRYCTEIRKH